MRKQGKKVRLRREKGRSPNNVTNGLSKTVPKGSKKSRSHLEDDKRREKRSRGTLRH